MIEVLKQQLQKFQEGEFLDKATIFLNTLGYVSSRTISEQSGDTHEAIYANSKVNSDTKVARGFLENAKSTHLIFQITDEEIANQSQGKLFHENSLHRVGDNIASSFLFYFVELCEEHYSRGKYASFAREINKAHKVPVVVLFKTSGNLLTCAFVHRRQNLRNSRDVVLGNVSMIREISLDSPHRAHLDILAELALEKRCQWLHDRRRKLNFRGLLDAWLTVLDTEELNKRFYSDLFEWFQRAVREATFPPDDGEGGIVKEQHVIRLISRLMFIWFIKAKGLVAEELFVVDHIKDLLKNYQDDGDSYYRAVLQNLFFATLNTEIVNRKFYQKNSISNLSTSYYRYRTEMKNPNQLLKLFRRTPFINGGLFDCLDTNSITDSHERWGDCFSDNKDVSSKLSFPNQLFFDSGGFIPLLNRYKFTVEENTPTEQEVALDPELLGKIFEHLLAAYNPETRDTARQETGSYYTPRPIVDYMVEEALVESLASKHKPESINQDHWCAELRQLLDSSCEFDLDAKPWGSEAKALVHAIANMKILDPAVGSGAFPMGVLHKLTLALRRLDVDNRYWKELQQELAGERAKRSFWNLDKSQRDTELTKISNVFEQYQYSDFGRKLYLIQNSIFGVDIQPIACQIAKLRFFISLVIEQDSNTNADDNYGIKPLPNLEARFVAADTLRGLESRGRDNSVQKELGEQGTVVKLAQAIHANRERQFHAATPGQKSVCRTEFKKLRDKLTYELKTLNFPAGDTEKIAHWDPDDQNYSADWFDCKFMFGMDQGFDVVIGNPPYIQLQKNDGELGRRYENEGYTTFERRGDIYQLFYEKGCMVLNCHGVLCYITSNSWLRAKYGKATRRWFGRMHTPLLLLELGKGIFDNAVVDSAILIIQNGKTERLCKAIDMDTSFDTHFPPDDQQWNFIRTKSAEPWCVVTKIEWDVLDKIDDAGTPLRDWGIGMASGVKTGCNDAFIVDSAIRQNLLNQDPNSAKIIVPILRGRNIGRYWAQHADLYLLYVRANVTIECYPAVYRHLLNYRDRLEARAGEQEWYQLQASPSNSTDLMFKQKKLLFRDMTDTGQVAYSESEMYCTNTGYIIAGVSLKYLCAVLNSTLVTWWMKNTGSTTGMGLRRWEKFTVECLPVPKISVNRQRPFNRLIDDILEEKTKNLHANTYAQEAKIDKLVYNLYGLHKEHICAIENRLAHGR